MSNKALSVDQSLQRAKSLAKKGEYLAAEELYRGVLVRFPNNKRAKSGLKSLMAPKADFSGKNVTPANNPKKSLAQGLLNRGNSLIRTKEYEQAKKCLREATEADPDCAPAFNSLASVCVVLREFEDALAASQRALELEPENYRCHVNIGNALNELKRREEALLSYHEAIKHEPYNAQLYINIGNILMGLGRREEAIASFNIAKKIEPGLARAYANLGNAYRNLNMAKEAEAEYREALRLDPLDSLSYNGLASTLHSQGRSKEAQECYERGIERAPDSAQIMYNLANIRKFEVDDPLIGRMLRKLADPKNSLRERSFLNFALGKAFEAIGDHDLAFKHIHEGNHERLEFSGYKLEADLKIIDKITERFEKSDFPNIANTEPEGGSGQRSIFIVGMPRSGTTLSEQIISSHSTVFGAGELEFMANALKPRLYQILSSKDQDELAQLMREVRDEYQGGISRLSDGEPVVTDKMPLNFRFTGFVLSSLPGARVVNLQRDPVATCWSVFKHNFANDGNNYGCDLEDVATFYKRYVEMMKFWHEKFPGQVYDLNYQALTENQEEESRKLLEFCGLEWEDQVLNFQDNKRAVQTASLAQVRKKMYTGSSEAWRKYETHLAPLIEALGV
ncbi:tetratricopeptide repeat-containing sulfotransferase family protein [Amaricoccus tamworthensis]|uniref:tetratricopeptide repeat-containing sulfotransferase family protein n=1 Tax=Amaricoccus tamworthensis TaxID=57002 RepID=UPI003C7EAFCD